jgi:hybrid cluster-associated redox disulfide protein
LCPRKEGPEGEAIKADLSEIAMPIDSTDLVDDVMTEWPATIRVFLKFKMLCVGCPIGVFHTVADACLEHGVALEPFLAELERAAKQRTATDDGDASLRPG